MIDQCKAFAGARGRLAILGLLLCTSCASSGSGPSIVQKLARNDRGDLQPQQVTGPCGVVKFFINANNSTSTGMLVGNLGTPCGFTIFNPDADQRLNSVFVTGQPAYGSANAALVNGNRQVAVSYLPRPGYIGHDSFSITIEPNAYGVRANVTVQATSPVPSTTP